MARIGPKRMDLSRCMQGFDLRTFVQQSGAVVRPALGPAAMMTGTVGSPPNPTIDFRIFRRMHTDEIEGYLADRHPDGAALFREFRAKALAAGPDVTEKMSRTMVAWKRVRTFATAYVKGRYLEVSIDLPEAVEHPHLRAAFKTSKSVTTHRFTLEKGESVDERMSAWLKDAYRTVGPGARAAGD